MPAINRASGCSITGTCGIGQGTCADDADCLGNLKCSEAGATTIPGVLFEEG